MKIGLLATHGVGKTTLCHYMVYYFGQQGIKCEFLPEVAREAVRLGLPINENTTLESQNSIQSLQTKLETEYEGKVSRGELDHFVCDRTRPDNYAYALYKFGNDAKDLMYDNIMRWLETNPYDIMIKIPLWNADKEITDDKIRSKNKQFQKDIDGIIDGIIIEMGLNVKRMPASIFTAHRHIQPVLIQGYLDRTFYADGWERKGNLVVPK